jgi:predicted small secreted protein
MSWKARALFMSSLGTVMVAGGLLSACNTIEGAGRDIQALGDSIEDEADEVKDRRRSRRDGN